MRMYWYRISGAIIEQSLSLSFFTAINISTAIKIIALVCYDQLLDKVLRISEIECYCPVGGNRFVETLDAPNIQRPIGAQPTRDGCL